MSNLAAFYNVVRRAQTKSDNAVSLIENVPVTTNASVILFAAKHIEMMEEQQAAMQKELHELRAIASVAKVNYDNHKKIVTHNLTNVKHTF